MRGLRERRGDWRFKSKERIRVLRGRMNGYLLKGCCGYRVNSIVKERR